MTFLAGCMGNKANKNAILYMYFHYTYVNHVQLNYSSSMYMYNMYMFIPVSKVFACLFDSKFHSFICCCFFHCSSQYPLPNVVF